MPVNFVEGNFAARSFYGDRSVVFYFGFIGRLKTGNGLAVSRACQEQDGEKYGDRAGDRRAEP